MTAPEESDAKSPEEVDLETDNLIATYEQVAERIRFVDAKAAVVLTVAGALASILIPTLKEYFKNIAIGESIASGIVIGAFSIWLILTIWRAYCAFRHIVRSGILFVPVYLAVPSRWSASCFGCVLALSPSRDCGQVSVRRPQTICERLRSGRDQGFQAEVLAGLLIDSHISNSKYHRVTLSIRLLGMSSIFALIYLIAVRF